MVQADPSLLSSWLLREPGGVSLVVMVLPDLMARHTGHVPDQLPPWRAEEQRDKEEHYQMGLPVDYSNLEDS